MDYPHPIGSPAVELVTLRITTHVRLPPPAIRTVHEMAAVVQDWIGNADREHFVALYMNTNHAVTHAQVVSVGTLNSTQIHPREVFKGALLANAAALVVAHNHPSGGVLPSKEDMLIVERLRRVGDMLGIELLDAFIVGPTEHFFCHSENRHMSLEPQEDVG